MFQNVLAKDTDMASWQPVRDLIVATPGMFAVSQNSPVDLGIPDAKWAAKISTAWDFRSSINDAQAGEALANRINAITATGRICVVDEIHGGGDEYDPIPMMALAIPLLTQPTLVYWYIVGGRYTSYASLDDSEEFPVITLALERGCGLLPEIYIPQALAERSTNIPAFIDRWYLGPGDGKMPYLLALRRELQSNSPIHFVYPVIDRFFRNARRAKLKRGRFLDLVMQRGFLRYPEVFNAGIGTYIWDSTRLKDPFRPGDFVALWNHYYSGAGAVTGGRSRYYSAEPRILS